MLSINLYQRLTFYSNPGALFTIQVSEFRFQVSGEETQGL